MPDRVINIVVVGLGGQGVLKAADIVAEAAFAAGLDVKKAEVHGMSQRGGSVRSDVRYGPQVLSPMVPQGRADFLLALDATQIEVNSQVLHRDAIVLSPEQIDISRLQSPRCLNIAMVGLLSAYLDLPAEVVRAAVRANLPPAAHEANLAAFELGRSLKQN
jgi:indolepyruvate ferredoxin oxidoreductase, beta subunit